MTGQGRYQSGLAAEEIAERLYVGEGFGVLARRWRCDAGEIDLIVGREGLTVFVEVKARGSRDAAAHALGPRQAARIAAAAEAWLAGAGTGAEARIDVVLVDGTGRAERIENAVVA